MGEKDEPKAAQPEPEPGPIEQEGTGSGGGVVVSPEVLQWITRTERHVRRTLVVAPEFRGRALSTCMMLLITADGRVIGDPEVQQSSGDVYWDDNAVRAALRASPLPAPPQDGEWQLCIGPDER
jgi:membrane protein involved in colicin uptake